MRRLVGSRKPSRALIFVMSLPFGLMATTVAAQVPDRADQSTITSDPPAHVSFVQGSAVLERDGQRETSPENMPLLAGDRVRTQDGRVEILYGDGSTLHLDTNTTVDFQSNDLVRLLDGRVRLAIPGTDRQVSYRIDAPSASALINQPGEYRLSILQTNRDQEIELAVLRGSAELANDDGRTALRAGQRAYARANAAPSYAYAFNSASWDAFDRWSESRRDQRLGVSTQYLPSEVQPYAPAFDQYGSWQYNTSYGYVWYPSVAVGWRPYYYGRWVAMRPYGWTWVGGGPWAWPTHHYGRWGVSAGTWFWIPGRAWAPAWVSWAYAPGYVSWCPLGWNNRAVLTFGFSYGYDPWRAWTVVPHAHFGVGYVNAHYVGGYGFSAPTRAAFVPRHTAPAYTGYAVPRASAPIVYAGTAGARASSSTVYTNLAPSASRVGVGVNRVMVGPSRSTVTPVPSSSTGSTPSARSRTSTIDPPPSSSDGRPRAFATPGVIDRSASASRQAVPRGEAGYRAAPPSQPAYGLGIDRGEADSPRVDDAGSRANPYIRRAPDSSARPGMDQGGRPNYQPYAVPRSGFESSPYGMVPRTSPDASRPAMPDYRSYGGDRRAPGVDRPAGPPPGIAAPPPGVYRANPGVAPAPAQAAPTGGSQPGQGQGHSRGGQPSTGTAVPRGRG
jgi:hypothetical protein